MNYKKEIYGLIKDVKITDQKIKLLIESSKEQRLFAEKVTEKYDANMDKRLDGMNQFKAQLEKQASTFPTRNEIDVLRQGYELAGKQMIEKFEQMMKSDRLTFEQLSSSNRNKITKIENIISNWQGRAYVVGLVYAIIVLFLNWFLNNKR